MEVDIVNKSAHPNPSYATIGSAGLDLRAFLKDSIILRPFERKVIPTGIYISLPIGYEAQVRPRSGLAVKHGLTVINSPGTIDSDYRGEIAVILANLSNSDFEVKNGDRIAQMVITKYEKIRWVNVEKLSDTDRGHHRFGSTGTE